MYRNEEDREAVVAFRGTESPKDMLTDMNLDLLEFNIPGHDRQSKAPKQVGVPIPGGHLEPMVSNIPKLRSSIPPYVSQEQGP